MSEPFIGEIRLFGFDYAPQGWLPCNGQLVAVGQYQALFALLGTRYGGNGSTNFGIPDFRGTVPIHFGQKPGHNMYTMGMSGGYEEVSLTPAQVPTHNHPLMGNSAKAGSADPLGKTLANADRTNIYLDGTPDVEMHGESVGPNVGGGNPHYNMQPFLTVNFCIAFVGLYPPRP
jgi:microcystin-dependent protein